MPKVIKTVRYSSRAISFRGRVEFQSMGKYVTDFLGRFKGPGWTIADGDDEEEEQIERPSEDTHTKG